MDNLNSKKPTPRWWVAVGAALVASLLVQGYRTSTGEELPAEFTEQLTGLLIVLGPAIVTAVAAWFAPRDRRLKIALEEVERLTEINGTVEDKKDDTYVEPTPQPKPKKRGPKGGVKH